MSLMIAPPPSLESLPAGYRLHAGLGFATIYPDLDFETYSEAGYVWNEARQKWGPLPGVLPKDRGLNSVGAAVYSEHPSTEVICMAYDLKDGRGKRRWRPGMPPPQELFDHIANGGFIESHNCGFEFWIWLNVCHKRYGWPMIPHAQQRCSMAKARAFGLPGRLAEIGRILKLNLQKDSGGDALLKKFSVPQNPTAKDPRKRHRVEEEPVAAERLYRYNDRDIETEAEASSRIPDLSPGELIWWQHDQLINRMGVQIDIAAVEGGIKIIDEAFERYNSELRSITRGAVCAASELPALKKWLENYGVKMYSMDQDAIEAQIKAFSDGVCEGRWHPSEIEAPYRALEIRQLIGSASVKKLYAMRNQASSLGRLHDLFSYHAARTGRVTGNGPQPTNLPNSGPEVNACACGRHYGRSKKGCPWCGRPTPPAPPPPLPHRSVVEWNADAAADAIEIITLGSLDALEYYFDQAIETVSACLRGMFVASETCDLISSDYTAIEAVVLACLAGEQWRVDLFRNKGKIYEASGAKVVGITYEEALDYKKRTGNHHPCRKKGKILELACGFGGWIGAMKNFGADEWMTEDEMKSGILAWRKASPAIVELWGGQFRGWGKDQRQEMYGLEGMAISAVLNPGVEYEVRGMSYVMRGDVLYCRLISGRYLSYHRPRLRPSDRGGLALSFEGWNTNPKKGPVGWIRMDLYGGLLAENVTQATARDILVHAVLNLWKLGYYTVLHVYDEIVAEVQKGWGSLEEFERVMSEMPPFAKDWPIYAQGGWRGKRYRK